MHLQTLALIANEAEGEMVEHESVVAWPAWTYGAIALIILLALLLVVTRLDLDR